jgi:hypothetical protein
VPFCRVAPVTLGLHGDTTCFVIRAHPEMKKMPVPGGLACLRFGQFEQVKKKKNMPHAAVLQGSKQLYCAICAAKHKTFTHHFDFGSICSTISPVGTKQATKSSEMPSLHASVARQPSLIWQHTNSRPFVLR